MDAQIRARLRDWHYWVLAITLVSVTGLVGTQILTAGRETKQQTGSSSVISLPNAGRPEVGHLAPDFALPATDGGQPLSLQSLKGRVVVLNFFYSTCPPCLAERGQIAQVANQLKDQVTVLGIDPVDSAANAQAFLAPADGPIVGLLDSNWDVASAYNIIGFPTTVVIDPDGKISAIHAGGVTVDELDTLIARAS